MSAACFPFILYDVSIIINRMSVCLIFYSGSYTCISPVSAVTVLPLTRIMSNQLEQLEYQECYHKSGHKSVINTMALSPDGHRLITGSDDCSVIVWSTKAGTIRCRINAHSPVLSLACFADSNGFLFGCKNGLIVSVTISEVCTLTWGLALRSSLRR
jgi:WD40 repeat protein